MKRCLHIPAMLLGALLLQCATAFAFQETDVPITAPERGGDHPALVEEGNGLGLSGADKSGDNLSHKKRSLYIPGFGTFENLPAIDFGLELLYEDDETSLPNELDDSMGIKGRLKHNF